MKNQFQASLYSFLVLLIISNSAIAQYAYYPQPHAYAFPPHYHYPPPPPVYGHPYYMPYRQPPVQQQAVTPSTTPHAPQVETREVQSDTDKPVLEKPVVETVRISAKKQRFIEMLLPHIEEENRKILATRQWLQNLLSKSDRHNSISSNDANKLSSLAKSYKVKINEKPDTALIANLLKHVDIIPASLTLAQAANETGWGTSRFAKEANNFFGIWTYDAQKGLKPKNRSEDKKHYVRKFNSAAESVSYYMQLLNSHPAYEELRNIRSNLRQENRSIQGTLLAEGLEKYSALGNQYIKLITQLIAQNQWAKLDTDHSRANT